MIWEAPSCVLGGALGLVGCTCSASSPTTDPSVSPADPTVRGPAPPGLNGMQATVSTGSGPTAPPSTPVASGPPSAPHLPPPPQRVAGRGGGGRGRGRGRGGGGRQEDEVAGNEIRLSEPTLYSLHYYTPRLLAAAGGGGDGEQGAIAGADAELRLGEFGEEEMAGGQEEGAGSGAGGPRFNVRASWLAGRPVWGDALVSLTRMTPTQVGRLVFWMDGWVVDGLSSLLSISAWTGLNTQHPPQSNIQIQINNLHQVGHHMLHWRTYTRRDLQLSLTALFPASEYARERHLPVTTRLPAAIRSLNSWPGAKPRALLNAYTTHHGWRGGRQQWDMRQVGGGEAAAGGGGGGGDEGGDAAMLPAAGGEGGEGGAAAAAVPEQWVARLTVMPFGREEPLVVESGDCQDS